MNKKLVIIFLAAVIVLGGVAFWVKGNFQTQNTNESISNQGGAMQKESSPETGTENKTPDTNTTTKNVGTYEAYSLEKIAKAQDGKVVLFFYASWCPTCRRLDTDIQNNLDKIPSGTIILKTDYDTEVALKQKYGVTYQHTLVQVDADGALISKWSGSPTLSEFLEKVI